MWTKAFWKDTLERVIATAAQAALGVLVASGIVAFGTWGTVAVIGTAALSALLKCLIAVLAKGDTQSPASLVGE